MIAIYVNPERLKLATQFGATETLLAVRADVCLLGAAEEVKRRTGGRGADYAFECTAVPELGPAPLAMIRSAGTAVGVSGIEKVVPVDMELFEWDKIYINPLLECPAFSVPVRNDKTVVRGAFDGTRQEAYGRAGCESAAAG